MKPPSEHRWWREWGQRTLAAGWLAVNAGALAVLVATEAAWYVGLPAMWLLGFMSWPVWAVCQE